tara:strand:+ start:978 stop:1364 length:387 start_codon:yes stop_codon:yes gene_type:complete
MPQSIITFPLNSEINVSVQETDIVYAVELKSTTAGFAQGGSNSTAGNTKPKAIGEVHEVDRPNNQITIETANYPAYTTTADTFLFFSKNRAVNSSGLIGYYSLIEYRNYSKKKAEIFAVGTEYAPSSK